MAVGRVKCIGIRETLTSLLPKAEPAQRWAALFAAAAPAILDILLLLPRVCVFRSKSITDLYGSLPDCKDRFWYDGAGRLQLYIRPVWADVAACWP